MTKWTSYNSGRLHVCTCACNITVYGIDGVVKLQIITQNCLSIAVINCGDPGTLSNGQHTLSSTTYNSVVTYTCDVGYTLQGSNSRTCQSDGQWSGSIPQCNRKLLAAGNASSVL